MYPVAGSMPANVGIVTSRSGRFTDAPLALSDCWIAEFGRLKVPEPPAASNALATAFNQFTSPVLSSRHRSSCSNRSPTTSWPYLHARQKES